MSKNKKLTINSGPEKFSRELIDQRNVVRPDVHEVNLQKNLKLKKV